MKIIANVLIGIIKIYKMVISPYLAPSCRYLPTCSEYSIEAIENYGFFKGLYISLKRIFLAILLNS